jgi:hypothetical protein
MNNILKTCVNIYNRVFLGKKEYMWGNNLNLTFIKFKVIELNPSMLDENKVIVSVELLDYRLEGVSKKMLNNFELRIFQRRMLESLKSELFLCSITYTEIRIVNQSKFLLPEKRKQLQSEFKIYTGTRGFDTLRESSYLFNDDRDDSLTSYTTLLGPNRFR